MLGIDRRRRRPGAEIPSRYTKITTPRAEEAHPRCILRSCSTPVRATATIAASSTPSESFVDGPDPVWTPDTPNRCPEKSGALYRYSPELRKGD
jgi:hypothetical protein